MKRQAYLITLRCRLNGCDWNMRLFLRSPEDAFESAYRFARYTMRPHERDLGKHWFRVASCEVDPDQSRPNH